MAVPKFRLAELRGAEESSLADPASDSWLISSIYTLIQEVTSSVVAMAVRMDRVSCRNRIDCFPRAAVDNKGDLP